MDDMSLWETMATGFVSSGFSSFITTPMDVVKTRMMLSASEQSHVKLSFLQMFKKVYRVGTRQKYQFSLTFRRKDFALFFQVH